MGHTISLGPIDIKGQTESNREFFVPDLGMQGIVSAYGPDSPVMRAAARVKGESVDIPDQQLYTPDEVPSAVGNDEMRETATWIIKLARRQGLLPQLQESVELAD